MEVTTAGVTHAMAGAGAGQVMDGVILVEVSVTAGAGAGVIQDMAGVITLPTTRGITTLPPMVKDMHTTRAVLIVET